MASDFDVDGRVRIDTTEVESLGSRMARSLGGIGAVVAGAFALDKLKDFSAGAIGVAADFQQTSISFTTMLGSGEKAGAFLGRLRDFAAKTPFEFPQLATAASSLVSVGINADKVIPIMKSLGNATAGMGTGQEGIKRATIALQQMSAAGRITGEDLNQLRDAGVPVFELLSKATGKSVEAVAELAQKGKLGKKELDQLFSALETGKGLERFNGLMDAQSQTLNGVISTLKDTLSNIAIDFITPYLPAMSRGLQSLADFITNRVVPAMHLFVDSFTAGFKDPNQIIGPGVGKFESLFTRLGMGFRELVGGVQALVAAYKDGGNDITSSGFAGAMERIGLTIRSITDAIKNGGGFEGIVAQLKAGGDEAGGGFSTALAGIATGIKDVVSVAPSMSDILKIASPIIKEIAEHADLLVKALPFVAAGFAAYKAAQAAANTAALLTIPVTVAQVASNFTLAAAIRSTGTAATQSAGQQTVAAAVSRNASIGAAASAVSSSATQVAAWARAGLAATANAIKTAAAWTLSSGAAMATAIASTAVAVGSVVAGWVVMGVQAMAGAARMAAAWFIALGPIGWVIAGVVAVAALVIANWDTISRVTGELWEKVGRFTGAAIDWLKGAISAGLHFLTNLFLNFTGPGLFIKHFDTIKRVAVDSFNNVVNFAKDAFHSITGAVSSGFENVIKFHREMPGKVLGALGDLRSTLLGAGKDLMLGLANGIEQMAGRVIDVIKRNITDKLPQFVKDALGIRSPSKVFEAIGKQVPAGFAKGVLSGAGAITDAMSSVMPATDLVHSMSAFSPASFGTGGSSMSTSLTIGNITITGVADAESVRSVIPELTSALRAAVGGR